MIGITFALMSESIDLIRQLPQVEKMYDVRLGKIGDREVAVIHTGVGSTNCNERVELLIHKARPEFVISCGFAGALSEQLQVGDLILAENFSDPALLGLAADILRDRNVRTKRLFTSATVIDSVSQRNEIAASSGAAAVDMETGSIVATCKAHGVPLLSLRAITDTPKAPFPAPADVLFDIERQRTNFLGLLSYVSRHPSLIRELMRFSKRIAQVRATLTDALVALVKAI